MPLSLPFNGYMIEGSFSIIPWHEAPEGWTPETAEAVWGRKRVEMKHRERPWVLRNWDNAVIWIFKSGGVLTDSALYLDIVHGLWYSYIGGEHQIPEITVDNLPWKLDTGSKDHFQ